MTWSERYRVLLVVSVSAAASACGGSVAELAHFLHQQVDPASARNAAFYRYRSDEGAEVYHLGTVHGEHLTSPAYPLAHLGAVIHNLAPSVVLLEVRPEDMAAGNLGYAPIEMPYAYHVAREAGAHVGAIDWWVMPGTAAPADIDRDDRMFALAHARIPAQDTVLILTGYSHAIEFRSRFEAAAFVPLPFPDDDKDALFAGAQDDFRFPAGMARAVDESLAIAEHERQNSDNTEWRETLSQLIARNQGYLDHIERVGEVPRH